MNYENNDITKIENTSLPQKSSAFVDVFDTIMKALIAVFIISCFLFRICTVIGSSMNMTLSDKEKLIITNLFYTPKENDIIVFHKTGTLNEPIVKRVICTGDKWIKIDYDTGLVYVSKDDIFEENDIIDETSYVYLENGKYKQSGSYEVYVPKGCIFVMGDNRNGSLDSRSKEIGLVDEKTVLGKVIFRLAPFENFGFIK